MRKMFLMLGMLGSLFSLQAQSLQSAGVTQLPVGAAPTLQPAVTLSAPLAVLPANKQDMKSLFLAMPDSIVPLLTEVNRADCVDFLASDMKAEVKNRFGKPSELKQLTDHYLCLQLTSRSTLAMKLLPVNDSVQVICAVRTVEGPVADSRINFYTTGWQPLDPTDFLALPTAADAYLPADSVPGDADPSIRLKADMDLWRAELSAATDQLTWTYTTPQYLVKDDREKLQAWLKQTPLVYVWKEGRFVRQP